MADKDYTIRGPDGREVTIRGPENATPEQLRSAAERAFASPVVRQDPLPTHAVPQQHQRSTIQQDAAGGLLAGVGQIGSTILLPVDLATGNTGRRAAVRDTALDVTGADPESPVFKGAELGAEIAGTGGVGPALARVAAARGLPRLAQALATGGFMVRPAGQAAPAMGWAARVGEQGIRAVGGGVGGAAAAGLVNPSDATAGGALGAVLPGALGVAGAAGRAAGRVLADPFRSVESRVAPSLGAALPDDPAAINALVGQLRGGGQSFLPGSLPNAAEATGDPGLANLVRAVQAAGGRQLFDLAEANAAARTNALQQLGGVGDNVGQVRDDLGREIERRIIPEDRRIGDQVSALFQGVDRPVVGPMGPQQPAAIELPLGEMDEVLTRYLGPGTVGIGADARAALDTAGDLTRGASATVMRRTPNARGIYRMEPETVPGRRGEELVGWEELQNLRSTIGDLARDLRRDPRTAREATALEQMQAQIDNRVTAAARGELRPGEVFTPDMLTRWTDARAAAQARQQRFRTGPQRELFERDASGLPRARAGEIPGLFWNSTPGQVDDVRSFRTLVEDNPHMLDMLRGLALTEANQGVNAAGDLTARGFSTWLENRLPAITELFDPQSVQTLQAIQADLNRSAATAASGRVAGSNTAQLQAAMQGNALLESPLVTGLAQRLPLGVGSITGPALLAMRDAARRQRVTELAEVLADPGRTANALQELLSRQAPLGASASNVLSLGYRAAPVALPATD